MSKGAKFIGLEPTVRIGDKPVLTGQVVSAPPELVKELLARVDFVATDLIAELELEAATHTNDGEV